MERKKPNRKRSQVPQKGNGVVVATPNENISEDPGPSTTSVLRSAEIALSDPLKEVTRRERLYLLGTSIVGITIVWTGLVPQEITTLGVKFGEADRQSLLVILALVIFYFWGAFAVYGLSDFLAWRYAYLNARWPEQQTLVQQRRQDARRRLKEAENLVRERVKEAGKARDHAAKVNTVEAFRAAGRAEEAVKAAQLARVDEEFRAVREDVMNSPQRVGRARMNVEARKAQDVTLTREAIARMPHSERLAVAEAQAQRRLSEYESITLDTKAEETMQRYSARSRTVSWVRTLFEFGLPLLVGLYAIYELVGADVISWFVELLPF